MLPIVWTDLGRGVLVAAVLVAPACTPEEDPNPYVNFSTPVVTDNGYFSIALRAAEGRAWPEYVGPTALKADIEIGREPAADHPQFHGDEPEPPFKLSLGPARPAADDELANLKAKTWPVTPDGFKWMVSLEFTAAGDWVFPLIVRDALGRYDATEIVFHIEPDRR
ncbi:hypothetical protein [Nannocystis radixulma]|uniref:Lipoprotein n=1 Tax=Nannocystis radixulma TaxID=2995305 RepID=A0ABT5BFM1_9BACT|nr:hypothetical protein [Nannocystis radixulma]MDC0672941.1 hypothetical protein [Nannocystis radixulma]